VLQPGRASHKAGCHSRWVRVRTRTRAAAPDCPQHSAWIWYSRSISSWYHALQLMCLSMTPCACTHVRVSPHAASPGVHVSVSPALCVGMLNCSVEPLLCVAARPREQKRHSRKCSQLIGQLGGLVQQNLLLPHGSVRRQMAQISVPRHWSTHSFCHCVVC